MRLPYDLLTANMNLTVAHEIGHLLGLGHARAPDDSEGREFIMMPAANTGRAVRLSDHSTCTSRQRPSTQDAG